MLDGFARWYLLGLSAIVSRIYRDDTDGITLKAYIKVDTNKLKYMIKVDGHIEASFHISACFAKLYRNMYL